MRSIRLHFDADSSVLLLSSVLKVDAKLDYVTTVQGVTFRIFVRQAQTMIIQEGARARFCISNPALFAAAVLE